MAISFSTQTRKAAFTKTITLAASKVLHIINDVTEDTDFQLTSPGGGGTTVTITITATTNA